jgi:hypothetical protein
LTKSLPKRGSENLPPSTSNSLDGIEQQIVQLIESEWSWQGVVNDLRSYAQRLVGYSIEAEFANLQISANNTLAQLRAAHHRAEAELGPLREQFIGLRNGLKDFQRKHRLQRIARTPSRRWTTFGLLSILIAVESVLNGFFFAKGSQFGLVGGIGIAIGISIFNVIFSFMLGLWPARLINFRNWFVKLLAFLATTAGFCVIVLLHGFAAHYRDAVAAVGEDQGMTTAINALTSSPWRLADMNSYYLFGLGLLAAISAFYKGCTFDDPYPFYGARSRAVIDAREEYSDEHAEHFDALAQIKDDTIQKLSDGITRIPLFPQQAANIRAQRAALVQTFRGYEASVATAANQLLSQYRDGNRRKRKTPVPDYFDRSWRLPHSFLDSVEVSTLTADRTDSEADAGAALSELRRLSQEVIDEYQKLLIAYPHPTQMAGDNGA